MAGTPVIKYQTTTRATAQMAGKPRYVFPLPQESPIQLAAYAFDAECEIALPVNFPPTPKNTQASASGVTGLAGASGDANAILTAYTQPQSTGAGMGKFSMRFNRVPASWDDFKTMPYSFPGWIGIIGQSTSRDIRTQKVTTRLHYDYFVADTTGILTGAGVLDSGGGAISLVSSASGIAKISKTYFFSTSAGAPVFNAYVNSLVRSGGQQVGTIVYAQTFPTVNTYQTWMANVTGTGWGGLVWNDVDLTQNQAQITQIVADDSWIQPYAGNIWERITPYILIN